MYDSMSKEMLRGKLSIKRAVTAQSLIAVDNNKKKRGGVLLLFLMVVAIEVVALVNLVKHTRKNITDLF